MNTNAREKKLLFFLLIVVVIYLSYNFLIKPQLEKIDNMEIEVIAKETLLTEMQLAEAMIPKLESENEELKMQLQTELSQYLGNIEQEDVILLINEILLRSEVPVDSIKFSEFISTGIETIDAETMSVGLHLEGTYKDVLALLSSFWRFDQNIFVSSLSLSGNEEGEVIEGGLIDELDSNVTGNAVIDFMRVNDEYAANEPIFKWFLDEVYDVENPFLIRDRNTFFNSNYYYIGKDVEFYNKEYVPFEDTRGHWIESVANIFGENGYMVGDENNLFYPDSTMTRMEFVILVDKLYRWPIVENPVELTTFLDSDLVLAMDTNEYKILQKAVNSGYVVGFDDNTLRPNDRITYSELEYFSKRVPNGELFNWNEFATLLQEEVDFTSKGIDNPNAFATKAEIVYMLYDLNR